MVEQGNSGRGKAPATGPTGHGHSQSQGQIFDTPKQESQHAERPIQVLVTQAALPIPETPGAPYFYGPDVSKFVRTMEAIFRRSAIPIDGGRIDLMKDYCSRNVERWIKTLREHKIGDYEGVMDRMMAKYAKQDSEQLKYDIRWLQKYRVADRETRDLEEFIQEYHQVSTVLKDKNLMSELLQGLWFLEGLPRNLRQSVIDKHGIDLQDTSTINYKKLKSWAEKKVASAET